MGHRGRKSAAELSIVPIDSRAKRLQAPAELKPPVAEEFRKLVDACPRGHFVEADVPLLTAYCDAVVLSKWTADLIDSENMGMITAWEKATKMMAMLATRLRLSPQSRIAPRTAGRNVRGVGIIGPRPWE